MCDQTANKRHTRDIRNIREITEVQLETEGNNLRHLKGQGQQVKISGLEIVDADRLYTLQHFISRRRKLTAN